MLNFHNQHYGCWWPGGARDLDIMSQGVQLVIPIYFHFSTGKVTLKPICDNIYRQEYILSNLRGNISVMVLCNLFEYLSEEFYILWV